MHICGYKKDGSTVKLNADIFSKDNKTVIKLNKENCVGFEKIGIVLCEQPVGHGYMFYPTNFHFGVMLTNLVPREDCEFDSLIGAMPVCGIGENENACMIHVIQGCADTRFHIEVKNNVYYLSAEWVLDCDAPETDFIVEYTALPNATYSEIARLYRSYCLENGCMPLKERVKSNKYLEYATNSVELRVRMGWKPAPTPELHQTEQNEPPMKVACDIDKLYKLMHKMQENGIKNVEFCLVGWGKSGHDGRFPQQLPSEPAFGGDEKLKQFISDAQHAGYQVAAHTNSVCAYEIANNFNSDELTHKIDENGKLYPLMRENYLKSGGLSGGVPYHLCARTAYENHAVKEFPEIAKFGFKGLHFVDELTACTPEKCYHPDHPINRKQGFEYYRSIAKLAKKYFGGYQSEAWMDAFMSDVDSVLYTSVFSKADKTFNPLFDKLIPFWQLVYHGIVLSNPSSGTVNYTLKDEYEHLHFIEYGGRPLMYVYSKYGEKKNWMGDVDLRPDDEASMDACIDAIKRAYDEFLPLAHLQYEFIENHEELSENIYRTTYSDGTQITVNYNTHEYSVSK